MKELKNWEWIFGGNSTRNIVRNVPKSEHMFHIMENEKIGTTQEIVSAESFMETKGDGN